MRLLRILLLTSPLLLAACDMLGIEPASALAGRREAEGKAVGGACRHAGRAIEDCYSLNKKADKAAVFAGWREMNDYMRENKIEVVPPAPPPPVVADAGDAADEGHGEPAKKPAKGAADKKAH
jgi:hypothetical protein